MPKATPNYNLYIFKPNLVKEWHPTKNGNLKPRDVTPGSGKKVWWICEAGHEWEAFIYSRSRGSGCRFCNKRTKTDNNRPALSIQSLIKEWHPTKNSTLNPRDVTSVYGKKQNDPVSASSPFVCGSFCAISSCIFLPKLLIPIPVST